MAVEKYNDSECELIKDDLSNYPKFVDGQLYTIEGGPYDTEEECQESPPCGCPEGPWLPVTLSWAGPDTCRKAFDLVWSNGETKNLCCDDSDIQPCFTQTSTWQWTDFQNVVHHRGVYTYHPSSRAWWVGSASGLASLAFSRAGGGGMVQSSTSDGAMTYCTFATSSYRNDPHQRAGTPSGAYHWKKLVNVVKKAGGDCKAPCTPWVPPTAHSMVMSGCSDCSVSGCSMPDPDQEVLLIDANIAGSITGSTGLTISWGNLVGPPLSTP